MAVWCSRSAATAPLLCGTPASASSVGPGATFLGLVSTSVVVSYTLICRVAYINNEHHA